MNLHELSADSKIEDIDFSEGYVTFVLEDFFQDRIFEIQIRTDVAFINTKLDEFAYVYCNIRKFKLPDILPIDEKSKLYTLPSDFISQMKAARQKFHLAVGLNSTEWHQFIQVTGVGLIIACPIKDDDSVDITEIGTLFSINPN